MSATSLKLPEGLKRRIARLAGAANKTAHAFMVEALSQEADRAEIRELFAKDAAISETETMESGKAVPLAAAFDYLEARAQGKPVRRPQARNGARPDNDSSARGPRALIQLPRGT
jgi:predicted transcriptional regulator